MFKILNFRGDGAFWPMAEPLNGEAAGRKGLLGRMIAAIGAELSARRAMHSLGSLDERMLRDIGIERDQIWYVARRGRELSRNATDRRSDQTRWS